MSIDSGRFRADVAVARGQEPRAAIEVIATHPPSESAAAAQAELESAGVNILHVPVERVSSDAEMFVGYRSPFCWAGRKEDNGSVAL